MYEGKEWRVGGGEVSHLYARLVSFIPHARVRKRSQNNLLSLARNAVEGHDRVSERREYRISIARYTRRNAKLAQTYKCERDIYIYIYIFIRAKRNALSK